MYKDASSLCAYDRLTSDEVSVNDLAEVRQIKAYKVKVEATTGRDNIQKGLVIMRYAAYIQDNFPNLGESGPESSDHPVNEGEDYASKVLNLVFGLSKYQQEKFWSSTRYNEWKERNRVEFTLKDLLSALATAKP